LKKIKIIQIISFVLVFLYIALFIIELATNLLKDWKTFVFSAFLAVISVTMIYKGKLLKSTSTLWFANTLILCAIIIILSEIFSWNILDNYCIFLIIPLVASIINLVVFHSKIYWKVIIFNVSVLVPALITYFYDFSAWINVVFWVISVAIGILISRSINLEKESV